ncbi:hypothetical protein FOL46_002749 [Perkinsus olseni]|uniref:Uncharacterized protein n=1 Tax=Perkinsus olseni TaxID=32597 RepID=A0A7J6M679_PEROL|nr:hypothetical protein FOL46_002749 [Perkinsus olseni]
MSELRQAVERGSAEEVLEGQMNTVSEAFPRDLSHAALGTTLVCQVDDNTISLGLCKVLGFRKAEYEESDYIFVILKRWNVLVLDEKSGFPRDLPSAYLPNDKGGSYRAKPAVSLMDEKSGFPRDLLSAHLLKTMKSLEPVVPQDKDTPQWAKRGKPMAT